MRTASPAGDESPMNTVPIGFSTLPPSGPAIPVIPIPSSAPAFSRAPRARASATFALTAPCASRSAALTPTSSTLARFEYVTKPRSK